MRDRVSLPLAALIVVVADQLTKAYVASTLAPGESRRFIPPIVSWTYVQNHAGAFGMFGTNAALLVGLAVLVLVVFWLAYRGLAARSLLVRIAFGMIAGGAIGNIIDRIHYHFVVDFIDLRWWPVFNIADSCISIGVIALVLVSLRSESIRRHAGG